MIWLCSATASVAHAGAGDAELRSAVFQRLLGLKSVEAEFDEIKDYTPSKDALELVKALRKDIYQGRYDSSRRFMFLDGRVFFETTNGPQTLARARQAGAKDFSRNIFISTPERFEALTLYDGVRPSGVIGDAADADLPDSWLIDTALGLRGHAPRATWIDKDALDHAELVADPASPDTVILKIKEGSNLGLVQSWWCKRVDNDVFVTKHTRTFGKAELDVEIDCDDFHKIGGFSLPGKITATHHYFSRKDGTQTVTETDRITVSKYVVDGKDNTPDKYVMPWPKDAIVSDNRHGGL